MRGRNPDVLTCIANLSSGHVFTPSKTYPASLETLQPGGTLFHQWATTRPRELLARIRDIRASERLFYRNLTGIYATSIEKVCNTEQMNQAVFAFRRHEDASRQDAGIDSHPGLIHYGLCDTVVARA